jgi:hypothetical protein
LTVNGITLMDGSNTSMVDGGTLMAGDDTLVVSGGTLMVGDGTLAAGNDTLAASGGNLMVDRGTLTAGDGMLAVSDGTLMVDCSTRTVDSGTLTSDNQHRLSGAIANATRYLITRMSQWRHNSTAITESAVVSPARLGYVITRPNKTLKMKIQSCTLHVVKLDSIRTIVRHVQTREENLYHILTLLFSQYLYADLTRCHISMVVTSIIASMTRHQHHQPPRCTTTNVTSATPSPVWLGGLTHTSSTSNPTQRFTTDQTRGA